jgi:hypothetical protein
MDEDNEDKVQGGPPEVKRACFVALNRAFSKNYPTGRIRRVKCTPILELEAPKRHSEVKCYITCAFRSW